MKKPIFKKWWFWLIIVFLVVVMIGNWIGGDKDDGGNNSEPQQQQQSSEPQEPADDAKVKTDIQTAVDALIAEEYKGNGYYCEILTKADGSGYIVDVQLNAEVEPPESTEIIDKLVADIEALENESIAEIQINVLKDGKIVDQH